MIFILHSYFSEQRISSKMGVPEYSYYFVLKKYLPLLSKMGEVKIVNDPLTDVDPIYHAARKENKECIYLSFRAPQNTALGLDCPTISVFAWEFDSIPEEIFENDRSSDWVHVFNNINGVITHSNFTVDVVRDVMGSDYPMVSAPAPVWDDFAKLKNDTPLPGRTNTRLELQCPVLDSRSIDLEKVEHCLYPHLSPEATDLAGGRASNYSLFNSARSHLSAWYQEVFSINSRTSNTGANPVSSEPTSGSAKIEYYEAVSFSITDRNPKVQILPPVLESFMQSGDSSIDLDGIVYTTALNPSDGRKNWHDIVCAFCIAFRDTGDATLVLKLFQHNSENMLLDLIHRLYQLSPFSCRVVVINGFLDDINFNKLIEASTYVVNASHGEGQCLPLMEFMSAGIPAIAPRNSGMADYINEDVAFVVDCSKEAALFPHDPRAAYRTCRYRINWQSLLEAFENSYELAKNKPQQYADMSTNSQRTLHAHCSEQVIRKTLEGYFQHPGIISALNRVPKPEVSTENSEENSKNRDELIKLANADGWFDISSRQLYSGFQIESEDIVLNMDSNLYSPLLFCSDMDVKILLHGTQRSNQTQLVKQLEKANTHYFRALLSDSEKVIPFADASVSKILLLESLQYKQDPLAYLKEAVRVGKEGAKYLLSVPISDSSRDLSNNQYLSWNDADFKHLVTVAGLTIDVHTVLDAYWSDLSMLERLISVENTELVENKSQLIIASKTSTGNH